MRLASDPVTLFLAFIYLMKFASMSKILDLDWKLCIARIYFNNRYLKV